VEFADVTAAGWALLDDADAAAQRVTLGLVIGTDVPSFASPAFTGTPTAPTAAAATDTTQIATTAYTRTAVKDVLNAAGSSPLYACRAWVNFNGTATVAIRASGNVSSITDNGAGEYRVNFTTAMSDVNYSVVGSAEVGVSGTITDFGIKNDGLRTGYVDVRTGNSNGGLADSGTVSVAIFR
jgi:hypothetical protein